jgi:hypothetical protein
LTSSRTSSIARRRPPSTQWLTASAAGVLSSSAATSNPSLCRRSRIWRSRVRDEAERESARPQLGHRGARAGHRLVLHVEHAVEVEQQGLCVHRQRIVYPAPALFAYLDPGTGSMLVRKDEPDLDR